MKLKNDLVSIFKQFLVTNKFIIHNKLCFKKINSLSENIILVELHKLRDLQILNSYLCNSLAVKYNAKIFAYHPKFFKNIS
mgnify:FL=1